MTTSKRNGRPPGKKMENNLNNNKNGRQPIRTFKKNKKWKMTLKMEDYL
jgi:hypothetical protein